MTKRIPTAGYISRTTAIRGLRDQGKSVPEIAAALKLKESTVRDYLNGARSNPAVVLSNQTVILLTKGAELRGITVARLAARILRAVARDDLVSAVLDDEARLHRAKPVRATDQKRRVRHVHMMDREADEQPDSLDTEDGPTATTPDGPTTVTHRTNGVAHRHTFSDELATPLPFDPGG